jgi:hypothetical protein
MELISSFAVSFVLRPYCLDFKTEGNDGSLKKSGEEMIAMYKEAGSRFPGTRVQPASSLQWAELVDTVSHHR